MNTTAGSHRFPVLNGPYLSDLLAQPKALRDTIVALRTQKPLPPKARKHRRVVLTGMGSSLHALHPLQIRLVGAGMTSLMVETAELIHAQPRLLDGGPDGDTVVVAVSQSGRSAETTVLLDRVSTIARKPLVIGVTNTAGSPLAERADLAIETKAGVEFSVSCKTYLATLAALEWLGGAFTGADTAATLNELESASAAVESYLHSRDDHVGQLMQQLKGLRHLFITGRGASLAAVGTAGLTLKESTRFHAEGMSSAAFRHGPLEMVGPGLFALVFAGDASTAHLNESLARDIAAAGGTAALVSERAEQPVFRLPAVPERCRPIVEMLPAQMISLALSVLAGREPGVFEKATKITATQ